MPREFEIITAMPVPPESGIAHLYKTTNLADAFAIALPAGASNNPEVLGRFLLAHQPAWIAWLMLLRDLIVANLGLKTAKQLASLDDRMGIFKIYSTSPSEIVMGEDDKHLDFRLSLLCAGEVGPGGGRQLVLSTVVHCHNRLGRAYIFVIAPFHRWVVKASLRRAARIGWPLAAV